MKIMHIAYGHRTDDTRIFKKECISLVNNGYEVLYVTSDKASKETADLFGVKRLILPLRTKNRLARILLYMHDVKQVIKREKPEVCHIHDIQIIFLLLTIPRKIKKIFDSHEDYPAYLADTTIKRVSYKLKYSAVELIEKVCFRNCKHIITATPYIKSQISRFHSSVTDVCNYPIVRNYEKKETCIPNQVCFTGGAGKALGITSIAKAIKKTKYKLIIAGNCSEHYLQELKQIAGDNIEYIGYLDKTGVDKLIEESLAGMVTYLPTKDCLHAIPNKMFEYMERGIPIIYSNFPDWNEMLNIYNVGIAVNPNEPSAIFDAIEKINSDMHLREYYSINGRRAIEKKYNWGNEEKKLVNVYDSF